MLSDLKPNPGKNLYIEFDGHKYPRFSIKTHIITKDDDIVEICKNMLVRIFKTTICFLLANELLLLAKEAPFQ
jgi:hypothetical protein